VVMALPYGATFISISHRRVRRRRGQFVHETSAGGAHRAVFPIYGSSWTVNRINSNGKERSYVWYR
jgi:hypothetical protein